MSKDNSRPTNRNGDNYNDRVQINGEAVRGREADNIRQRGYENPKEHYIRTSDTEAEIAEWWDIPVLLMRKWITRYRLHALRKATEQLRLDRNDTPTEAIAKAREDWTMKRANLADEIIQDTMDELRNNVEFAMSATGDVVEKKLSPAGRRILVDAIRAASDMKSVALGLPTKITGQFSHSTSERKTISTITVHAPDINEAMERGIELDPAPLPPLPEGGAREFVVTPTETPASVPVEPDETA